MPETWLEMRGTVIPRRDFPFVLLENPVYKGVSGGFSSRSAGGGVRPHAPAPARPPNLPRFRTRGGRSGRALAMYQAASRKPLKSNNF